MKSSSALCRFLLQRFYRVGCMSRGQRAARQVHVVAGPEEEDAPDAAPIDVLVRPRGSQAGVRVAGVWRDDRTRSAARGLRFAQPAGQLFCQLAAVTRVPAARERGAPRRHHQTDGGNQRPSNYRDNFPLSHN